MKPKIPLSAGLLSLILLVTAGCNMYTREAGMRAPAHPIVVKTNSDAVPAGTELPIRTDVDIDSNKPGGTFEAELAQAIVNEKGQTLIPAGTPAQLVIAEVNNGGAVSTRTMELALRSLVIDGKVYAVKTSTEKEQGREGIGANRRTAEILGGGALLGAIIGAATGSGPGAAAGAAYGAAAGATVQILTRGKEVKVPAETLLKFRLNQPISVVV